MSSDQHRIRRPKLPRTAARRSLSVLFVPPPAAATAGGAAAAGSGATAAPWNDVIARSVELGYRVIDDYVRQGEQVARTFGSPAAAAPAFGSPAAAAAAPAFVDPQDFARRMSQYAMDVTTLWLQMLQVTPDAAPWARAFAGFAAPAPAGSGAAPPTPFAGFATPAYGVPPFATPPVGPAPFAAPSAAPPPAAAQNGDAQAHANGAPPPRPDVGAALRVSVAISSVKLTEVVLDLRPDARAAGIEVHALRDDGKPRIQDVTVQRDDTTGSFTVRIRVPEEQPAGTYRGAVIDAASGRTLGSLELRVGTE